MTSVGNIWDQISILELRKKNNPEIESDCDAQVFSLLIEFSKRIKETVRDGMYLYFKKNKRYQGEVESSYVFEMDDMFYYIEELKLANQQLWHIEDERRNDQRTDAERLELADNVSEVNRTRNFLIDRIDECFYKYQMAYDQYVGEAYDRQYALKNQSKVDFVYKDSD